jgi:MSHA biogenesis protein MshM
MYYEHFGLSEAPFRITPNTDFFFGGGNRGPILEALIYAITQGEGIVKVTGEVGSGKTMLCSMLQSRLPENVETIYLANPSVSPEEILHAIAFELNLPITPTAPRLLVLHAIQAHLLKRHGEGKRVVLFIEESQGMPIATLEEIRLLSNLETKSDKLLQIVLFGQPELDDNLRENSIRQLKERISHSFRLEPLTVAETREYLMFRLRAAGYRGPDLFSEAIVREIARISGGLTRRINLITDKALLAAFSENTHSIRQKHLDAAVRDSEFARNPRAAGPRARWLQGALLVIAGMVAGAAIFALTGRNQAPTPAATDPQAAPAIASTPAPESAPAPASAPTSAPASPEHDESKKIDLKSNTYDVSSTATATPSTDSATAPEAATEASPPTGSLLEARLAATRVWLDSAKPRTHTIQLLSSSDDQQLNHHLKFLSNIIEINSLFVYRTVVKGAPALNVVWGSFDSQSEAREAMAKLPASLKAYRPLLRTVQGIKAEVRDRKTS